MTCLLASWTGALCCVGVTVALTYLRSRTRCCGCAAERTVRFFSATFCLFVVALLSFTYAHALATCICIFGETAHAISPLQPSNRLAQMARHQKCKTLYSPVCFPETLNHSRATAGCYCHAGSGFVKKLHRPSLFVVTTTMRALLCPRTSLRTGS